MCGIVGFTGAAQAAPILLDGLAKLEYRGYDSAGLAVQNAAGKIEVVKAKGRLKVLSEMTDGGNALTGTCGIGHTRWATHGEPSVAATLQTKTCTIILVCRKPDALSTVK